MVGILHQAVGCSWGIHLKDGSMEVRDWHGDLFTVVSKVNNVYLVELAVIALGLVIAAWMNDRGSKELTHQEIVARFDSLWSLQQRVERVPKRVY